jgi:hypothetical protein
MTMREFTRRSFAKQNSGWVRSFGFVLALLALLGLAVLTACSGSPTRPTPDCNDPRATNYGQPGECKFVDSIKITNINTPIGVGPGGTIKCGQNVGVTVTYTLSQFYPAIPDGLLWAGAGLSKDGIRSFEGVSEGARTLTGTVTTRIGISNCSSPIETGYIIGTLEQTDSYSRNTIHAIDVVPYLLKWQP